MEKKYIHYCWFGNNPLPKLAKKCIKSWKKYLPDYEIIRWSEENVDLNECPFIKEAYEKKKWAFVADYARTKAIYEYGGIYLDTDVMIKKDINNLLDIGTVLGIEDSRLVNAAVWIESKPKSWFSKKMLDFYQSQKYFDEYDIYSISIPRIITKILINEKLDTTSDEIQKLNHNITIYPRDYFYPLSYDHRDNIFTDNTCMVHYFDASWIPKWEQRENKIFRILGQKRGRKFIDTMSTLKRYTKKGIKLCLFPAYLYVRYKRKITPKYLETLNSAIDDLNKVQNKEYLAFYNPEWFGVANATIELFDNTLKCGELLRQKDVEVIGNIIISKEIKQVIFSAMCLGWKDLAIYLKEQNPDIKVKVFWHGNHSQVSEPYGWARNLEIFEMNKQGIVDVIGTCKKSLMNFYEHEGYKAHFITNIVKIPDNIKISKTKNEKTRIGLYAAKSDDWRKNMFTQIAAISLMDNVVLDMVPLNEEAVRFAKQLNIEIDGVDKPLKREDLISRMSSNDINLYVTFSECAPMLPLESFAVNVPCLTGNNHHYFVGDPLEEYLVVNNEANPIEIKEKIEKCLKNKNKVLELYKNWDKKNKEESKKEVEDFLKM